jgi:hypothetical protein
MTRTTIAPPPQLAASRLEARCCENPNPAVLVEQHFLSKEHKIFCQNCLQELHVKHEMFLSTDR